jgi:hypothetical protein
MQIGDGGTVTDLGFCAPDGDAKPQIGFKLEFGLNCVSSVKTPGYAGGVTDDTLEASRAAKRPLRGRFTAREARLVQSKVSKCTNLCRSHLS